MWPRAGSRDPHITFPPSPNREVRVRDRRRDDPDPGAEVEYLLPVSPGTHYLLATLDDNENDLIDSGDLVPADGLNPKCVEVVITDADVDGVALNFVLP